MLIKSIIIKAVTERINYISPAKYLSVALVILLVGGMSRCYI